MTRRRNAFMTKRIKNFDICTAGICKLNIVYIFYPSLFQKKIINVFPEVELS